MWSAKHTCTQIYKMYNCPFIDCGSYCFHLWLAWCNPWNPWTLQSTPSSEAKGNINMWEKGSSTFFQLFENPTEALPETFHIVMDNVWSERELLSPCPHKAWYFHGSIASYKSCNFVQLCRLQCRHKPKNIIIKPSADSFVLHSSLFRESFITPLIF